MVLFRAVILLFFLSSLLLGAEPIDDASHFFSEKSAAEARTLISKIEKESGIRVWVDVYQDQKALDQREVLSQKNWVLIRIYRDTQLFLFTFDPALQSQNLLYSWDANYLKNVVATFFSQGQGDYGLYRVLLALEQTLNCNRKLHEGGICEVVPDQVLEMPAKRKPYLPTIVWDPGILGWGLFAALLALVAVMLGRVKTRRVSHAH